MRATVIGLAMVSLIAGFPIDYLMTMAIITRFRKLRPEDRKHHNDIPIREPNEFINPNLRRWS
jgi:hypothetical protein